MILILELALYRMPPAAVNLGFTYRLRGDLEAAYRAIADWMNSMNKVGNVVFAIVSAFVLADIIVAQGRLQIRIFVAEGPSMACLLYEAHSCGMAPDYAQRLFPLTNRNTLPKRKPNLPNPIWLKRSGHAKPKYAKSSQKI